MEKLALEFDEVFWDKTVDLFNLVQDDWTLVVNCYKFHTGKPILLMFNYGRQCDYFNSLTDEEILVSALAALKKMFPTAPSSCKSFLRTRWAEDKYAKMSYTFVAVGSSL